MTAPRLLVVPGGTAIGAVALANASIHKLVELYEERQADPNHPAPHTVVILRTPEDVPPATLRGSAVAPEEAFPEDRYPGLAEAINADPHFFDGIDLVVPTSGSSAGSPRLVGLSIEALMASAKATELALEGPGRWILAMPAHHIAGAMILLRAAVAETNPQIVDTSEGFDPRALLPAIQGATQDDMPGYLPLVPTQLAQCLDAGEEVVGPMRSLASILVGGAATNQQLLARATEAGLKVRLTYGMTETAGGCVYDGKPLPGTSVRAVDWDGRTRLAIHGPTLMTRYLGRPTPVTELRNLPLDGRARILLKREDLVHGGAHKGNQVLGQALLARRMGKKRVIAETGAGQHGTATAMVCALLGLECTIYMGATDVVRQAANVERMELMGARVVPVASGAGTLKDAVNEALRDWTASFHETHYLLGTAAGPHPFPTIVHEYHRVISVEARAQVLALTGRLPDEVIACVGGGSNAIGVFSEFIDDPAVRLTGVEPAGEGLDTPRHGAAINAGKVGILHGARSYLMRTSEGQVEESFSVSAGLDYPGVGPEHAWLADTGRATYVGVTDAEALEAFRLLSRHEGIVPALESAHALAHALRVARDVPADAEPPVLLVCLSGRGDKDLEQVARLGPFCADPAVERAARMVAQMGRRPEYAGLRPAGTGAAEPAPAGTAAAVPVGAAVPDDAADPAGPADATSTDGPAGATGPAGAPVSTPTAATTEDL